MQKESKIKQENNKTWFFFMVMYLVVDFVRIQDIIPIGFLRPGLVAVVILGFFILRKGSFHFEIRQIKMIYLFLLLLAIHIPFAKNNYYAYKTTEGFCLLIPFILSIITCLNTVESLKKMINIWIWMMIYIALFSIANLGKGSGGYFSDENDLSLFLNLMLPFCYFLLISEKGGKKKLLYGAALIIGLIAEVKSFSRGGFVGLTVICFVIWWFSPRKMLSAMLVLLMLVFVIIIGGETYLKEMETISDLTESTAQARFEMWGAAWKMFLDNPFGVGGNNFPVRFEEYQSGWFLRGMWGMVAHSLWFTLIPELGIPGIIIYFTLLYYNLKDLWFLKRIEPGDHPDLKYIHYLTLSFIASFAGYFSSGTFISVLYYPYYWYFTAFIIATMKVAKNVMKAGDEKESLPISNMVRRYPGRIS